MNTHFKKARVFVIFLIFGVCVYFFKDWNNFEALPETRFILPPPKSVTVTKHDKESGVTHDCNDWNLQVDLSAHPLKPPAQGEGSVSVPELKEDDQARKASFEWIYAKNWWGGNQESKSGRGSTRAATRQVVSILHSVTDHLKSILGQDKISFLDSSCGDMNWMPDFLNNRTDVEFHGYDITKTNIDKHKKTFRDQHWTFKQHDIVSDSLSRPFDLILSRHTMFHLYSADVIQAIKHFKNSRSKFLLMTTHAIKFNQELPKWPRYRKINLLYPPFSLPAPLCVANDIKERGVYIILYDLNSISM